MKASELRIGNYILQNGDLTRVVNLDNGGKSFCVINDIKIHKTTGAELKTHKIVFEYAPLTNQILLDCMFEHRKWYFIKSGLELLPIRDLYYRANFPIKADVKHLHQLQNLYFALTGEELEIKNTSQS